MRVVLFLLGAAFMLCCVADCGGGTEPYNDPCEGKPLVSAPPQCIPPVPLPCTYPCQPPPPSPNH